MSLKTPDCVNFLTRCHAEIIGRATRREAAFCGAGRGKEGRREKTKDGCRVTQRPPAELAGGSRGPINSAEQNSKILDAGMEATTASPCCWWPTGDIYRYTYKKNTLPV